MKIDELINNNYNYYLTNKEQLCEKYLNKYIILKDEEVYGVYKTIEEAIKKAKDIEAGTYIIQKCEKKENAQIFHTRVRFNA